MNINMEEKKDVRIIVKLILGSIIGLWFFMFPFNWNGSMTIPLSFFKDIISAPIKPALPIIVILLTAVSAIGALIITLKKNENYSQYVKDIFAVSPFTLIIRILAVIVTILAYFQIGPEQIWNENTGGLIVFFLMPSLLLLFLLASTMLPLLTQYGSMELIGSVLQPVFKPLFKIPGRSAVLALSSWFGSGTIGMITTEDEYKKGYYTGREAAIICFGFCIITLPSVFIYSTSIGGVKLSTFGYYFFTLCVVGIISTMIIARIPPISKVSNEYYQNNKNSQLDIHVNNKFSDGFDQAYGKAKSAPGAIKMLENGFITAFKMYMNVFPLIVFLATVVLVITEYTPVFSIIATPLVPVLNFLGIPEASAVAPSLLIGFADLLLPFLAATSIQSELAKFIVCIVGTIQVICMSETGAVMLKSEVPVNFKDVILVFLEKTVIAVVIALIMGRLIGLS